MGEPEEAYVPQFIAIIGAPSKSVRIAFCALHVKQKLGLADEEASHWIREKAYMKLILGLAGYTAWAPLMPL
jgi:hypothetical protein